MKTFPISIDYIQAVVAHSRTFQVDELKTARFALNDARNRPLARPGQNAVVFRADIEGDAEALRFFTYMDDHVRNRYLALADFLPEAGLDTWLTPPVWVDDAVEVKGELWPLVRMDWVEGRTLDDYVGTCVTNGDVAAIERLAEAWRDMIGRLQDARFAHGDLQHNNVLVDADGGLHLIDFDGSWVPGMHELPAPKENGHRNYQRDGKRWDRWMDTFPALVVYLSLTMVARQPNLWHALHTSDCIAFAKPDFQPPHETAVWRHIASIDDTKVTRLANELLTCCRPDWPARGPLSTLLLAVDDWHTAPTATPSERLRLPRPITPLPVPPPRPVSTPAGWPPVSQPQLAAPRPDWWYGGPPRPQPIPVPQQQPPPPPQWTAPAPAGTYRHSYPRTSRRPARRGHRWVVPAGATVVSAGFAVAMFLLQLHTLFVAGVVLFVVAVVATVVVARGR